MKLQKKYINTIDISYRMTFVNGVEMLLSRPLYNLHAQKYWAWFFVYLHNGFFRHYNYGKTEDVYIKIADWTITKIEASGDMYGECNGTKRHLNAYKTLKSIGIDVSRYMLKDDSFVP